MKSGGNQTKQTEINIRIDSRWEVTHELLAAWMDKLAHLPPKPECLLLVVLTPPGTKVLGPGISGTGKRDPQMEVWRSSQSTSSASSQPRWESHLPPRRKPPPHRGGVGVGVGWGGSGHPGKVSEAHFLLCTEF